MEQLFKFGILNLTFAILFSTTAFAEDLYSLDEPPVYEHEVKHILTAFDDEKYVRYTLTNDRERMRHWSYSIYYCPAYKVGHPLFLITIPAHLIFLSHGDYGRNGYQLFINGTGYSDYAAAVDWLLTYFRNEGNFNGLDYSYVLVNTCYPGYMNYESYLPQMNVKMIRAIDHKDITAHSFVVYGNGNVKLRLYKAHLLHNQGVESTRSSRNGTTDVIDYNGEMMIIGK